MSRSFKARQVRCTLLLTGLSICTVHVTAHASEELEPARALTGKAGGLTAEHVAARATATSFAAEQKRYEVAVAAENLDRAVYDFIPRVTGQASYFRLSPASSASLGTLVAAPGAAPGPLPAGQTLVATPLAFESSSSSTTLTASLTLPLSDYVLRLVQTRESAAAQLESSQLSLVATRRKAAYDARALYYDWVRAVLETAAAEQNQVLSREHSSRLRVLAQADAASPADVARAEASEASAERVLVQARNLAALQQERVRIVMHDELRGELRIGEDFTQAPAERPELDDVAQLTRTALTRRPELRALSLAAASYDRQADATRAKLLPRLDALGQATWANPNQRYFPQRDEFRGSWQVGVQLGFSLNDTLTGKTQIGAARAQALATLAQRSQLLDAVRSEVVDAVLAQRTARASLKSSTRRLAAAETSYRARYERFAVGQATFVELTEAQTELLNAKLEAVQACVAVRVAAARIAYVSGTEP